MINDAAGEVNGSAARTWCASGCGRVDEHPAKATAARTPIQTNFTNALGMVRVVRSQHPTPLS